MPSDEEWTAAVQAFGFAWFAAYRIIKTETDCPVPGEYCCCTCAACADESTNFGRVR